MPLYEFRCEACGARAEVFHRRISDEVAPPVCPEAGDEPGHVMRRAVSRFAAHKDFASKLEEAEATYGKEVDAAMGSTADVDRYAKRYERLAKDLPPGEGP